VFTTLPTWDEKYKSTSNKRNNKKRCRKHIGQKYSQPPNAYPTRGNQNSRFNRLKEEATNQRLTTIRQKQSSTKPIKAQRLTTKQKLYVKFNHLAEAQQRLTILGQKHNDA